jgi:hypothetical protein
VLFASDVAVWIWFKFKCYSSFLACQFSLLWVGIISTYSLTRNQQLTFGLERQWHYLEWLCWSVLNFSWIRFWYGISIGRISRSFIFDIFSKKKYFLRWTFSLSWQSASFHQRFLGVVCALLDEPFSDFQTQVGSFIYSGGRMSIDSLAIN